MSTLISLRTGGTLVVPESIDEVNRLLDPRVPHVFHPEHRCDAGGTLIEPEPIALRLVHVGMLQNATVRRRPEHEPARLESGSGLTFTDLFESDEDYQRWARERYNTR